MWLSQSLESVGMYSLLIELEKTTIMLTQFWRIFFFLKIDYAMIIFHISIKI
jgi:phage-related protein